MLLDPATTSVVALAGAGAGVLGLGVGLGATVRLARLRRAYRALAGDAEHEDVLAAMARHVHGVTELRQEVTATRRALEGLRVDLSDAIRHVAVVRYDAFQDMGGRMSFSAALLDDTGDGLVLTSINGRSETRSYAKGVKGGQSEHLLSPEEQQALAHALRAAPAAAPH
ncbi:MAG: DUF4446 family protein [Mycobacteriales bacterium]